MWERLGFIETEDCVWPKGSVGKSKQWAGVQRPTGWGSTNSRPVDCLPPHTGLSELR